VAPASFLAGAEEEEVPPRTESRLKGRPVEMREVPNGGSMRVNGAEMRRPAVLRFGERPAGAVDGARGEDMLARAGVDSRDGMVGGGGMDLAEVKVKAKGLMGASKDACLLFLDWESRVAGSTFSPSASSKMHGSKARLVEVDTVLRGVALVLPSWSDCRALWPTCSCQYSTHVTLDWAVSDYHSDGS